MPRQLNLVSDNDPSGDVLIATKRPEAMSDAELVAAVLHESPSFDDVTEARKMLCDAGSLYKLSETHPHFAACTEFLRRYLAEELLHGPAITKPEDCSTFLRSRLRHLPYEVFACMFLDCRHQVIGFEELFRGTVDGAPVPPREVVRACIKHNAEAVIFAHNHPSGVARPSQADLAVTLKLREALRTISVRVLDHMVVGASDVVSMTVEGLL